MLLSCELPSSFLQHWLGLNYYFISVAAYAAVHTSTHDIYILFSSMRLWLMFCLMWCTVITRLFSAELRTSHSSSRNIVGFPDLLYVALHCVIQILPEVSKFINYICKLTKDWNHLYSMHSHSRKVSWFFLLILISLMFFVSHTSSVASAQEAYVG